MEDILKKAELARQSLLPLKSEAVYQKEYEIFAEGYLEDSIELKNKTARMLSTLPSEEAGTSTVVNKSTSHTQEEIVSNGESNFQGTFQNCTFLICNDK